MAKEIPEIEKGPEELPEDLQDFVQGLEFISEVRDCLEDSKRQTKDAAKKKKAEDDEPKADNGRPQSP